MNYYIIKFLAGIRFGLGAIMLGLVSAYNKLNATIVLGKEKAALKASHKAQTTIDKARKEIVDLAKVLVEKQQGLQGVADAARNKEAATIRKILAI